MKQYIIRLLARMIYPVFKADMEIYNCERNENSRRVLREMKAARIERERKEAA